MPGFGGLSMIGGRLPLRGPALAALGIVLALAGCNPVPPELRLATGTPFTAEWCQAAKELPNHGGSLSNVAKCHERNVPGFPRDEAVIAAYYTQAARWGDPDAMANLARLGQPIPDDDLRREAAARAERERTMRTLATALRPAPAPQPGFGARPAFGGSPGVIRPAATPTFPTSTNISRSVNESVSERRNCTNNVCRTERTVCRNGVCNTTVTGN
jgi:hypothetical protein